MPIDFTRPPQPSDVEGLLRGAEYWPETTALQAFALTQAEINVAAAVEEFQKRTGWKPFVNTGDAPTTRYFASADYNGVLSLDNGLLSFDSVTAGGREMVLDTNLYLSPPNAEDEGTPFTELQFYPASRVRPLSYQNPRYIAVRGVWGRFREWPADAWKAVLYKAGLETLMGIQTPQVAISVGEDAFNTAYDPVQEITPGQHLREDWRKLFDQAVQRYRRVVT